MTPSTGEEMAGRPGRFVGEADGIRISTPPDHEPEWNAAGYDMALATRYVYAFVRSDRSRVKVGTVGRWSRLASRLREVANQTGDPDLWHAADVAVHNIDGHALEGIEASMQTWLAFAAGLPFAGAVDWLTIPDGSPARDFDAEGWQQLVDQALATVLAWREEAISP